MTKFADQAVIAIENTRLLNELRESLAAADRHRRRCCRSSRSSPGDLQPVFQAMLENAIRICEAKFGNLFLYEERCVRSVATTACRRHCRVTAARRCSAAVPNAALGRVASTKQVVQFPISCNRAIPDSAPVVSVGRRTDRISACRCSRRTS